MVPRWKHLTALLGLFAWLGACAGEEDVPPLPDRPDCHPIVGNDCLSGFPTAFYLREDAGSTTGLRVDLPARIMPVSESGDRIDPTGWNRRDGFSQVSPVYVLLDRPVDPESLVPETDPARSLDPGSASTIMYNASREELIAHFAEVDLNVPEGSDRQALILRPWTPLGEDQRIVVALTRRLRPIDGSGYQPTPTMERLLAGKKTGFARIDDNLDAWLDGIEAIEDLGVEPEELLAVWPTHTLSQDWTHGVALALRDDLLEAISDTGMDIQVERIEVNDGYVDRFPNLPTPAEDERIEVGPMHGDVALRLRGTFEMPLYLTSADDQGVLNWEGDGPAVARNGTIQRPFVLLVPPSVVDAGGGAPLMLYGHGLFRGVCVEGCLGPGKAEFMPHFVHASSAVAVGTDWWGLSQSELGLALTVVQDISRFEQLIDKLVMAALGPIALTRAVRGRLLQDPMFFIGSSPVADAEGPLAYYGNSLGGIMGTTMVALHPDLDRMVMNVPAIAWSTLLNRSIDFSPLRGLMAQIYADPYHLTLIVGMIQTLWDLSEPAGFAPHVVHDPFPGTRPGRRALWTVSMGDCQVSNLASGMLARAARVPLVTPAVDTWYRTETIANPVDNDGAAGGAVVQWDSKRGSVPPGNKAPDTGNHAHYATRYMPEFQQMVWRFLFDDGVIDNRYCIASGRDTDGDLPCDLEQVVPESEDELPPLPEIPPPPLD